MSIKSISIKNYKSYENVEDVQFSNGFNIILGKNNVGKTAILECLSSSIQHHPHKSLGMERDEWQKYPSEVNICYELPLSDLSKVVFKDSSQKHIKVPNASFDLESFFSMFINKMNEDGFLKVYSNLEMPSQSQKIFIKTNSELFDIQPEHFSEGRSICFNPDAISKSIKSKSYNNAGADVFLLVANLAKKNTYRFEAERLKITTCEIRTETMLVSNAENLPSVLNYLKQKNPRRFDIIRDHIKNIFPNIFDIALIPIGNNAVEIYIWPIDPDTQRDDLLIPLKECGTGVAQILAILYVVIYDDSPRTIIIDEPNTFLHPAASKKLIRILKEYPQHQYIVSTHSAEVFRAADPDNTLLVTYEGGKSHIQTLEKDNLDDVRSVLSEVGTNMSDIFAADNILWVEGKTEEDCFREIARTINDFPYGTSIVSVVSTGDLEQRSGKQASLIIDIYERLSKGNALIPPSVGFIFDRENKTDKDIDDLTRRFKDHVEFLKCRMFENYLLDSDAITRALNKLKSFKDNPIEKTNINAWIKEHHKDKKYYKGTSGGDWQEKIDGAKFFSDLFSHFSEGKEEFHKTRDNLVMTKYLLENNKECFTDIVQKITTLLNNSRQDFPDANLLVAAE